MTDFVHMGGDVEDIYYRYKRPKAIVRYEGRGSGKRSVIVNLRSISKAMQVLPLYPTKFFGIEFGARSCYDQRKGTCVINGVHAVVNIESALEKFVSMFILCPSKDCNKPEIQWSIAKKKRMIRTKCAACGHIGKLNSGHRLCDYILNNPPGKNYKKKKKGGHRYDKKCDQQEAYDDDDDHDENTQFMLVDESVNLDENEVVWTVDTSDEAVAARRLRELGEEVVVVEPPLEIVDSNVLRRLTQSYCTDFDVVSELQRMKVAHTLTDSQCVRTFMEVILQSEDVAQVPSIVDRRCSVFKSFVSKSRCDQLNLIRMVAELLVNQPSKKYVGLMPHILKMWFDNDVVEEEYVVWWYDNYPKADSQSIRDKAGAFVEWLKHAESESESTDQE